MANNKCIKTDFVESAAKPLVQGVRCRVNFRFQSLFVIVLVSMAPYAHASDFSGLTVLFTVPLSFICFVISMFIAHGGKTKNSEIGIFFVNIPNWIGIFFAIAQDFRGFHTSEVLIIITLAGVVLLLSIMPFFYLNKRLAKHSDT